MILFSPFYKMKNKNGTTDRIDRSGEYARSWTRVKQTPYGVRLLCPFA